MSARNEPRASEPDAADSGSEPACAIVTGAGSGIGRAIALQLFGAGFRVALVGRDQRKLAETAAGAQPAHALVVPADLSAPGEAARVGDLILAQCPRVSVLINNAADVALATVAETSDTLLRHTLEVNLVSHWVLVSRLWATFVRRGGGCVVSLSSLAVAESMPGLSAYCASKAALETLTRAIVYEGAPVNIRAYCVVPGAVDTPLLRRLIAQGLEAPVAPLSPDTVAAVVLACVRNEHPADGRLIEVPGEHDRKV